MSSDMNSQMVSGMMINFSLFTLKKRLTALLLFAALPTMGISAEPESQVQAPEQFTLPTLQPPHQESPLSQQQQVYIQRIRLRGSTVLSEAEVKAIASPYIGRQVAMTELPTLRRSITQLYLDKGYISSSALIPDQTITDGDIVLTVVEGKLEGIIVSGTEHLAPDYVLRGISLPQQQPVNLAQLQEHLVLLKQDPMINRLGAELIPGNQPGSSVLNLKVEESKPYHIELIANNARSPSIGSEQVELTAGFHSLTGWGDRTTLRLQKTEGLQAQAVDFLLPVSRDIEWLLAYQTGESEVIEQPFNEIDVESEFYDALIGMRYRFSKQLARTIDFGLLVEKKRSKTFLFGDPYSFSAGVDNGVSTVSVVRLTANWIERKNNQVFLLSGTLSQGLNLWGATINDHAPDGRFTSWLGQFQYAYHFSDPLQELLFRWDFKLTNDSLLPLEKLSMGGVHSVRGYRENTLVTDQGMISSLEYRFGILNNQLDWGTLQAALFVDYGIAENKASPNPQRRHLSSAGMGLRWQASTNLTATIYAAKAFKSIENDDHDLQDSGIHFEFKYRFF